MIVTAVTVDWCDNYLGRFIARHAGKTLDKPRAYYVLVSTYDPVFGTRSAKVSLN